MATLKGSKDRREPKGRFRRRKPGQPPLSVFRAEGRYRGLQRVVSRVPLDRRGRDRPRPRPSRIPRRGGRSGDRQADRHHRATICGPRSPAKPTNTPTCIRGWPAPPAKKASRRSPSGSRPSPRPRRPTPAASRRRSTLADKLAPRESGLHRLARIGGSGHWRSG